MCESSSDFAWNRAPRKRTRCAGGSTCARKAIFAARTTCTSTRFSWLRWLVAEGLDFGTSLTWWRGPDDRRPVPAGEGPRPARLSSLDAGYPRASTTRNSNTPGGPPTSKTCQRRSRWQGGTGPTEPRLSATCESRRGRLFTIKAAGRAKCFVDALLGCVHTVNVCNNNFALHRFQPRSRYSNLLERRRTSRSIPIPTPACWQLNTDTYYRLLNCGLRLAAGGGSATGVKQAPVGYNRAYVARRRRMPRFDEFYEAWKSGRNFVTNGPMLILRTDSDRAAWGYDRTAERRRHAIKRSCGSGSPTNRCQDGRDCRQRRSSGKASEHPTTPNVVNSRDA